jgi:TRAP-type C4-dicarboxylate transport system permease small subunit
MESAKRLYRQAMEGLYVACIGLAGVVMVVMTVIIPYGVFMRYVMNSPSSWPEPMGILLMIVFSLLGGAAAYRAKAHIAVSTFINMLGEKNRERSQLVAEVGMIIIALFMIKWGVQLVNTTWYNTIAEFPTLSVGITYIPIPVAGLVTLLFVIERLWIGEPPQDSYTFRDQPQID